MKSLKPIIIAIVTISGLLLTATMAGILGVPTGMSQANVSSNGNVVNIGVAVYSDPNGQTACTNINWGSINPSGIVTKTVYIKNEGNRDVTLSMSVSNWNPVLSSSVLSLSWDRQNYVLPVGQTVAAVLTLTAASDTGNLADFSFTITIAGTW